MRARTIRWIIFPLVSGLLFGCSEDNGIKSIDSEDPLEPPEENHVPVIVLQSDTFAIVGDTLRLDFSASDPDGDVIHFEKEMACTWGEIMNNNCHPPIAHIDSRDGSFWFYPRIYDIPTRHVFVTVIDGRGGSAYMGFDVSVSIGQ